MKLKNEFAKTLPNKDARNKTNGLLIPVVRELIKSMFASFAAKFDLYSKERIKQCKGIAAFTAALSHTAWDKKGDKYTSELFGHQPIIITLRTSKGNEDRFNLNTQKCADIAFGLRNLKFCPKALGTTSIIFFIKNILRTVLFSFRLLERNRSSNSYAFKGGNSHPMPLLDDQDDLYF